MAIISPCCWPSRPREPSHTIILWDLVAAPPYQEHPEASGRPFGHQKMSNDVIHGHRMTKNEIYWDGNSRMRLVNYIPGKSKQPKLLPRYCSGPNRSHLTRVLVHHRCLLCPWLAGEAEKESFDVFLEETVFWRSMCLKAIISFNSIGRT